MARYKDERINAACHASYYADAVFYYKTFKRLGYLQDAADFFEQIMSGMVESAYR